jgi:hypothetical protein
MKPPGAARRGLRESDILTFGRGGGEPEFGRRHLLLKGGAVYGAGVLKRGDIAPDFAVGERTVYQMLVERTAVIFFFPKAFTPG